MQSDSLSPPLVVEHRHVCSMPMQQVPYVWHGHYFYGLVYDGRIIIFWILLMEKINHLPIIDFIEQLFLLIFKP
ncbi:hypothetical protein RJT34_33471 [Clitoria ternatea]|uniref:Uncharacterized protein n=1 Tax=Clitoria ternatea TaxID=43366 RepID=A0AAN9EXT1_CLITE